MNTSGIDISKKSLYFGGVPLEQLIKKYKTPFFAFSEQRVIDNYNAILKSFKKHYSNTFIYYSAKTNFEIQILKSLLKAGSHVEIAGGLELSIVKKAGFKPENVVLDGPYWSDEDIKMCIADGIHIMNVDSIDMLYRVNAVAKKLNKKVKIGFRVYPEIKISMLKTFVENYISKFGFPISEVEEAFKIAQGLGNVDPVGIHTHIGSMITQPDYHAKTAEKFVDLAAKLKKNLDIKIEEINIGGGYGVQSLNYFSIQNIVLNKVGISQYSKASSIEEFGQQIATAYKERLKKHNLPNIPLILEPGRFIASDSGILVTKVVAAKKHWIFLDGGANIVPESIFFIRRGFIVANKFNEKPTETYGIAGPSLSTPDILAVDQKMPKIEVGDTVLVLDAGAYTLSRSNQFTMLRPDAIYIKTDKKITYLRRSEKNEEFIKNLLP